MRTLTQLSHPDDLPEIREGLRALLSGEIDVYQREFRLRHAEGHYVWASLTTSLVRDDDGRPLYRLSQVQDIDGRKRAEDKLRYLADHDALTGVVNRRRFELELAEQIGQSNADGGRPRSAACGRGACLGAWLQRGWGCGELQRGRSGQRRLSAASDRRAPHASRPCAGQYRDGAELGG